MKSWQAGQCRASRPSVQPWELCGLESSICQPGKFPYNAVDQAAIKAQLAGYIFPNVIGDIDCTHISIKVPPHDENVCVNRQPQLMNTVPISCLSLKRYEKFTVGETFFFIDCGMKEIPTSKACLYRAAFTYGGEPSEEQGTRWWERRKWIFEHLDFKKKKTN